jgi:PBP1b-binding outer membrane lipoprotein LpoB
MNIIVFSSVMIGLLFFSGCSEKPKGKIKISCDQKGAIVYVNNTQKAMIGDGYTNLYLEEGEYEIKIKKPIDDRFEYMISKTLYVGADTSVNINFELTQNLNTLTSRYERKDNMIFDRKLALIWQDNSEVTSNKKR